MDNDLVEIWRSIIVGGEISWVMFEQGTCVILMQPESDLAAQATAILAEWGPVQVGTPSADFNIIELAGGSGWVVTCHHPDILNYVPPDEEGTAEVMIGLMGRATRDQDAQELKVAHVEDKRREV